MKNPFITASNLNIFRRKVSLRCTRVKSLLRTLTSCHVRASEDCTTNDKLATKNDKLATKNDKLAMKNAIADAVQFLSSTKSKTLKLDLLYLLDKDGAKKFASLIASNLTGNSSHVIELNPGYGFLTEKLLDAGIPFIHLFEATADFVPHLTALSTKYPNRILFGDVDFQHFLHTDCIDWRDNTNKLDTYFKQIKEQTFNKEPCIQIIGSMGSVNLINQIVYSVVFNNTLFKYGKPVTYGAVPPSVTATLKCTNENYNLYKPRVIMFQTLFRYRVIGHLPRSIFYPKYKITKKSRNKFVKDIHSKDAENMHIVKIEPRLDIFDDEFAESEILMYFFFVRVHLRSRKSKIIPSLENSLPGCGRILIAHGFNIFTEFGELKPDEILSLFKRFKSFPGFKNCTFVTCFSAFLSRIDEHIIFDDTREHVDELFQSTINEHENAKENSKD